MGSRATRGAPALTALARHALPGPLTPVPLYVGIHVSCSGVTPASLPRPARTDSGGRPAHIDVPPTHPPASPATVSEFATSTRVCVRARRGLLDMPVSDPARETPLRELSAATLVHALTDQVLPIWCVLVRMALLVEPANSNVPRAPPRPGALHHAANMAPARLMEPANATMAGAATPVT